MFLSLRSHLLLACRSCVSSRCAQAADPREREGVSAGAPAAVEVPVIPDDTHRAQSQELEGQSGGPGLLGGLLTARPVQQLPPLGGVKAV